MSLTSELKNNKELSKLIENFLIKKNIKIKDKTEIKFNLIGDFRYSAIVGTAYDYLLRVKIAKENKIGITFFINSLIATKVAHYLESNNQDKLLINNYKKSIKNIIKYLNSEQIKKEKLLSSLIYLSFMDEIYRSGKHDLVYSIYEIEEIKLKYKTIYNDLNNLTETLIDLKEEFIGKKIFLNPTFKNSSLLGGADADLIIDDILIDIKTVVNAIITKDMLSQLIGYLVLADFDNIKINKIGIYFSRYNELQLFDINDIITKENYEEIKNYFRRHYEFKS